LVETDLSKAPGAERLLTFLDWWLPATTSADTRRRSRICAVILLLCIVLPIAAFPIIGGPFINPILQQIMVVTICIRILLFLMLRSEKMLDVVCHLVVATFLLLILVFGLVAGGPYTPLTVLVPLVPAMATLLLSLRGGTIWTAATLVVLVFLTVSTPHTMLAELDLLGVRPTWAASLDTKSMWLQGASASFTALLGWIVAAVFEVDRRARIADLDRALVHAEEAAAAKSRFLANMSHEIRTPMSGVVGIADLLAATEQTSEQQRMTRVLQSSSRSMVALLNDILDMSRIDAGMLSIEFAPVDLRVLIDDVIQSFRATIDQSSVHLSVDIDPTTPKSVDTDELRLRQILTNLLSNALKFTDKGSIQLQLTVVERTEHLVELQFALSDTGIGMDQDTAQRVLKPFQQADPSTTRKHGGTGLGLTIVQHLARALGGGLSITSAVDAGTTVEVSLCAPIRKALVALPTPTMEKSSARVLLAEDDPVSRTVARMLLESLGVEVDEAVDGPSALESAAQGIHDLILMDVHMPELDGLVVTRRLRALGLEMPIVALTASAFAEDRQACLSAGMNTHLAKPARRDPLARLLVHYGLTSPAAEAIDGAVSADTDLATPHTPSGS
jgi:signal transduction histidine kinase/CheY-like chemotaxis protein